MLTHRCARFYPNVYACEFLSLAAAESDTKMDWAQANALITSLALVLNLSREDLARILADSYLSRKA